MEEYGALLFETRTAASRARTLLAKEAVVAFLRRRTDRARGCVFTLLVPRRMMISAEAILRREGVSYEVDGK